MYFKILPDGMVAMTRSDIPQAITYLHNSTFHNHNHLLYHKTKSTPKKTYVGQIHSTESIETVLV